jgi:hypothetical protein
LKEKEREIRDDSFSQKEKTAPPVLGLTNSTPGIR